MPAVWIAPITRAPQPVREKQRVDPVAQGERPRAPDHEPPRDRRGDKPASDKDSSGGTVDIKV